MSAASSGSGFYLSILTVTRIATGHYPLKARGKSFVH
jgi:hypothetical protein